MPEADITVHLTYEYKFIPGFIKNLETLDLIENNYFLYIGSGKNNPKVKEVHTAREALDYILERKANRVVIHFLKADFYRVVYSLPPHITVAWIFYGAEFYNRGEVYLNQLLPDQKKRFFGKYKSLLNFANLKSQQLTHFFYKTIGFKAPFYRALERVNYMAHWIKEDYENLVRQYGLKTLSFVPFYYSTPIPIGSLNEEPTHLLIGNSAAFTNNHLHVLEQLSPAFTDQFDKIILPISYGGAPRYKKLIREVSQKLGDKVLLLDDFMEKEAYFALMKSVKLAIYATRRSQAGNNIRWAFHHGIDVALHTDNAMYRFYTQNGLKIHTLDDTFLQEKTTFLTEEERLQNREEIANLLGEDMRRRSFENLLQTQN
jgi:dTDP-N-acetylfucosamine:lipid II N-acetylfucosaminyltransferase